MGYNTQFQGMFEVTPKLDEETYELLMKLSETRRMARNVAKEYGVEGEFYVDGTGLYGSDKEENIIDYSRPPKTQPSLWCKWTPTEDREHIAWNNWERFYCYIEWLQYIVDKILAPKGYKLNGKVLCKEDDTGNIGAIIVDNNNISVEDWEKIKDNPFGEYYEIYEKAGKYYCALCDTVLNRISNVQELAVTFPVKLSSTGELEYQDGGKQTTNGLNGMQCANCEAIIGVWDENIAVEVLEANSPSLKDEKLSAPEDVPVTTKLTAEMFAIARFVEGVVRESLYTGVIPLPKEVEEMRDPYINDISYNKDSLSVGYASDDDGESEASYYDYTIPYEIFFVKNKQVKEE